MLCIYLDMKWNERIQRTAADSLHHILFSLRSNLSKCFLFNCGTADVACSLLCFLCATPRILLCTLVYYKEYHIRYTNEFISGISAAQFICTMPQNQKFYDCGHLKRNRDFLLYWLGFVLMQRLHTNKKVCIFLDFTFFSIFFLINESNYHQIKI